MQDNKVIIGAKAITVYIASVVFAFENNPEIELSAIGNNVNKQERIIRLLSVLGVVETGRRVERVGDINAIVCCLKRRS